MLNRFSRLVLFVVFLVSSGGFPSEASTPGEWEPYGLTGYDVLHLSQDGPYIYAAVYPSPLGPELFGHGIWRRHEHPDSSWVQIGLEGLGILGIWVHPEDPSIIYASVLDTFYYPQSDGHLLYLTMDGGSTWNAIEPGPDARGSTSVVGTPSDPMRMLLSAYPESHVNRVVYMSTDSGDTWTGTEQSADVLVYSPVDDHTVWTTFNSGFFTGQIFRSTDDGQTWEEKFYDPSRGVGPVALSPTGRVYVVLRGAGVMRSDNDGQTWIVQPLPPDGGLWDIDVSPGSPDLVMTAEYPSKGSVWLSADAGSAWTDISATLPDSLTFADVMASRTEPGVFYLSAEGYDIANTEAGVWRYQAETVVATPSSGSARHDAVRLTLRRNPVSGSAVFAVSLPLDAIRSPLRVFDAQGRAVAELAAWRPTATGTETFWDGTTSAGARATPGVYFGVVETSRGEVRTRFVWLE